MRWAHSYSIIDHQLLHAGHLARLSHEALSLYLFLVVVGDRDGRSFYGQERVCSVLRLNGRRYNEARRELLNARLIAERGPYTWVLNLGGKNHEQRRTEKQDKVPARCRAANQPPDRARAWNLAGTVLADMLGQIRR